MVKEQVLIPLGDGQVAEGEAKGLLNPAHIGTDGNELANAAAKAATLLPAPPSVHVSLTTCKRRIREAIIARWDDLWKLSTTGRALRTIDRSSPSLILRHPYITSIPAPTSPPSTQRDFAFARLIPQHVKPVARRTPEISPAWEHLHPALQHASYSADLLGAVDVPSLLTYPKLLKALVAFVTATQQFS